MVADFDTQLTHTDQIEWVCRRFAEALRSGDTIDGYDAWLSQVPESLRGRLRTRLQECQRELVASSLETRVLSSDAAMPSTPITEIELGEIQEGETAISRCRTFRGLSRDASNRLTAELEKVSLPCGSVLLEQGTPARGLFLIISGSVDIIDSSTGERIDCDGAGSVLGEMSLLTGGMCSAGVIATSDVEAMVLSTAAYSRLIEAHPELELALSQLVSDRLGGRPHDALCGKTLGGFRLIRCLNRGGMGVVYQAENCQTGEPVALKMLRHRFIYDEQMQSRFDLESQLLTSLKHPNIVALRSNFLAYRTRFLVLDLCDGADLYRLLSLHGKLSASTARAVLGQIAAGLQEAHERMIVHRDLKPGNVLVDRSGQVRITDFGLSRLLEAEGVELKAVGTPSYMPPEQFRSEEPIFESDWYAFGCLAYELVTGNSLFPGSNWMGLYDQKKTSIPSAQWPEFDADSDAELVDMIRGCLEPQAMKRRLDLQAISNWARNVPELFPTD
jgi:Protein kinase domain/Cyclic nucleotide-binding domain